MNNWKYRLMRFMQGRYGGDQFNFFLIIASFLLEVTGNIFGIRIIYWIGVAMILFAIYGMFSRNIYKRQQENIRFMSFFGRITGRKKCGGYYENRGGQNMGGNRQQRENRRPKDKTVYCYYNCPSCMQQVRVPAGKGKVRIKCPKCGNVFETHS